MNAHTRWCDPYVDPGERLRSRYIENSCINAYNLMLGVLTWLVIGGSVLLIVSGRL